MIHMPKPKKQDESLTVKLSSFLQQESPYPSTSGHWCVCAVLYKATPDYALSLCSTESPSISIYLLKLGCSIHARTYNYWVPHGEHRVLSLLTPWQVCSQCWACWEFGEIWSGQFHECAEEKFAGVCCLEFPLFLLQCLCIGHVHHETINLEGVEGQYQKLFLQKWSHLRGRMIFGIGRRNHYSADYCRGLYRESQSALLRQGKP